MKINVSGKGYTDFILQWPTKKQHDPEKDVEPDFSMQHADLAAAVAAGMLRLFLSPTNLRGKKGMLE